MTREKKSFNLGPTKVEEVLGEEPDVKEQLFEVLKQYAAERDVESLAEALPDILLSEEHQQLIDSVRYPISCSHPLLERLNWCISCSHQIHCVIQRID